MLVMCRGVDWDGMEWSGTLCSRKELPSTFITHSVARVEPTVTDLKQTFYDIYKFKKSLKRFLLDNSFYSLEEYYSWKENVSR